MVIFGGRGINLYSGKFEVSSEDNKQRDEDFTFNDTWSLAVPIAVGGKFVWKKEEGEDVKGRYQHSSLFIHSEMVVIGGTNPNKLAPNVYLNVYNTSIS
jgi:hypothetical protein